MAAGRPPLRGFPRLCVRAEHEACAKAEGTGAPAWHPVGEARGERARVGAGAKRQGGPGPCEALHSRSIKQQIKKKCDRSRNRRKHFFPAAEQGPLCFHLAPRPVDYTTGQARPPGYPGSGGNAPLRAWGHRGPYSDQCSESEGKAWGAGAKETRRRVRRPGRGSEWPRRPPAMWRRDAVLDGRWADPWGSGGHPRDPQPLEGGEKGRSPQQHTTRECARRRRPEDGLGESRRVGQTGGEGLTPSSLHLPRFLPCAGIAITIRKINSHVRGGRCRQITHTLAHPSARPGT